MMTCEWGDRAWWLIVENFSIHSPDKRFWACLGDLSQTSRDTFFVVQDVAQLSLGRIVLRVTIADGESIHPK